MQIRAILIEQCAAVPICMNYKQVKQFRLPYFNYASTGYYFVTICTKNRMHYFGQVEKGKMQLSSLGTIADQCWGNISISAPYVILDAYKIMPNHLHGILLIDNPVQEQYLKEKKFQPQKDSLSIFIRNFKAAVTTRAREIHPKIQLWQSRFFDRIIRNEKELNAVRKYIDDNPMQWEQDKNNPENLLM